ncbi:hypothetical protein [Rhizobium sp. C1]|uniref:hypothetical protein n=1 Tax=Rhizobium sp. C1 TaxID=1349799 RepID=UPI001E4DDD88|nr:hypothetical protein [Rhizobium sp. C1]MCD2177331.1 hypothetical protein [Rhizobium sp. C1]
MSKKNNKISKVVEKQKADAIGFNAFERFILNSEKNSEKETPHVNLKYYVSAFQCLSTWDVNSLRAFSAFVEKLRQMKWSDIYKTGGKLGNKTGLGYTVLDRKKYPKNDQLDSISEDITLFELRVDGESRVHGFRCLDAFYLVYLDKDHKICA